jgi:hypothetical protein
MLRRKFKIFSLIILIILSVSAGSVICIEGNVNEIMQTTTTTTIRVTKTTTIKATCESFCIAGCNTFYTVKPGDYPSQIAIDQAIPYSNLLAINNNFGNQYTGNHCLQINWFT